MKTYRIYPSIGIARVGNSDKGYYIGAESPDINFVPLQEGTDTGPYRDFEGKIKRMGCRFRIYEFDDDGVTPPREITSDNADITWEVQLVNKKAAKPGLNTDLGNLPPDNLTIDSVQQVAGIPDQNQDQSQELGGEIGPNAHRTPVKLGNLITDGNGRLIVLGGHGKSDKWHRSADAPHHIDNPGWYDDTSDGPVKAHLTFPNQEGFDAKSAWVIVGPPDYAHPMVNVVTLYDIVLDRCKRFRGAKKGKTSFKRDIFPVLHRTVFLQWTLYSTDASQYGRPAMHGHGYPVNFDEHQEANFLNPTIFQRLHDKNATGFAVEHNSFATSSDYRKFVFEQLKEPDGRQAEGSGLLFNMPPLEQLTLTPTQYENFRKWSIGKYKNDWDPDEEGWDPVEPPQEDWWRPVFDDIAIEDQPAALTKASLGDCVGGSFDPGIEAGSIMEEAETYQQSFRISTIASDTTNAIAAGDLTQGLSIPWQADFNLCTSNWWPGARPVLVIVKDVGVRPWTRPYTKSVKIPDRPILEKYNDKNKYDEDYIKYKAALYTNQRMGSNQEMVDFWSGLGFIAKDSSPDLQYIETDRTLPEEAPN